MRRLPAELIPRIPEPARKVARNAVWTFGRATARWRPLPGFLVIGAQKAGTTALYAYLRWHPAITGPSWKEVSFFDRHWWRGEAWYRGQFPLRTADRLVGEASPSYLFHPLAPERARSLVPDVKLIALLRNPVDRAYSQYQHEVALGREPLSFEDALAEEEGRTRGEVERLVADPRAFSRAWWDHTYAARGRYAEQLERWLTVFPPSSCSSSRRRSWGRGRPRRTPRFLPSSAPRRTRSTSIHASSTATTSRCGPRRARRSPRRSPSRTAGSRRCWGVDFRGRQLTMRASSASRPLPAPRRAGAPPGRRASRGSGRDLPARRRGSA